VPLVAPALLPGRWCLLGTGGTSVPRRGVTLRKLSHMRLRAAARKGKLDIGKRPSALDFATTSPRSWAGRGTE
jgi:hypothetical protein